jgi:hypothetical protein
MSAVGVKLLKEAFVEFISKILPGIFDPSEIIAL